MALGQGVLGSDSLGERSKLTFGGRWAQPTGVKAGRSSLGLTFEDGGGSSSSGGEGSQQEMKPNRSKLTLGLKLDGSFSKKKMPEVKPDEKGFWLHSDREAYHTKLDESVYAPQSKPVIAKRGVVSLEKSGVVILKKTGGAVQKLGIPDPYQSTTASPKKVAPEPTPRRKPTDSAKIESGVTAEMKKSVGQIGRKTATAEEKSKYLGQIPGDAMGRAEPDKSVCEKTTGSKDEMKRSFYGADKSARARISDEKYVEEARARVVRLSDILLEKNKEKIVDSWVSQTVQFAGARNESDSSKIRKEDDEKRPLELVGKEIETVLQQMESKIKMDLEKSSISKSLEDSDSSPRKTDKGSESSSVVTVVQKSSRQSTISDPLGTSSNKEPHPYASTTFPVASDEHLPKSSGLKADSKKLLPDNRREILKSSMTLDLTKKDGKQSNGSSKSKKERLSSQISKDGTARRTGVKRSDTKEEKVEDTTKSAKDTSSESSYSRSSSRSSRGSTTSKSRDGGSIKGATVRKVEREPKVSSESIERHARRCNPPKDGALLAPSSEGSSSKGSVERSSSESSRDSSGTSGIKPKSAPIKKPPRWK